MLGMLAKAGSHRREVDVEMLLQWAYRDELPKQQLSASAESNWERAETGMGGLDENHHAMQRYAHIGLPHQDAVEIARIVDHLPAIEIDWGMWRAPRPLEIKAAVADNEFGGSRTGKITKIRPGSFRGGELPAPYTGDLDGILDRAALLDVPMRHPCAMVSMHARMASRPPWRRMAPQPIWTVPERGKAPMVVGECRGRNLYLEGSYCPVSYTPSPVDIVLQRAEYLIWHHALGLVCESLDRVTWLADHVALRAEAPREPWRNGEAKKVILTVGTKKPLARLPLRPDRARAGKNTKPRIGSAVRRPVLDAGGGLC